MEIKREITWLNSLKNFQVMFIFQDGLVAATLYKQMTLQSKETGLAPDADFRQAYNEVRFPDRLGCFGKYYTNFRYYYYFL